MRHPFGRIAEAEILEEPVDAAAEPPRVLRGEPREHEAPSGCLPGRALELEGGIPECRCACRTHVRQVLDLEHEESRHATVELLGDRPHLPLVHDANQARLLEHLEVVPHRALRNAELDRELLRGSCALPQQADDAAAEVAAECAELLGILDEEDVISGVVDE